MRGRAGRRRGALRGRPHGHLRGVRGRGGHGKPRRGGHHARPPQQAGVPARRRRRRPPRRLHRLRVLLRRHRVRLRHPLRRLAHAHPAPLPVPRRDGPPHRRGRRRHGRPGRRHGLRTHLRPQLRAHPGGGAGAVDEGAAVAGGEEGGGDRGRDADAEERGGGAVPGAAAVGEVQPGEAGRVRDGAGEGARPAEGLPAGAPPERGHQAGVADAAAPLLGHLHHRLLLRLRRRQDGVLHAVAGVHAGLAALTDQETDRATTWTDHPPQFCTLPAHGTNRGIEMLSRLFIYLSIFSPPLFCSVTVPVLRSVPFSDSLRVVADMWDHYEVEHLPCTYSITSP